MKKTALLLMIFLFSYNIHQTKSETHFQRGFDLLKEKKYKEAIPHYKLAIEADEDIFWIYNNIVYCYISLGMDEESLKYARMGYKKYPDNKTIISTLSWSLQTNGWDYFKKKDFESSEKYFSEALTLEPENEEALNGLAVVYINSTDDRKIHQSVDLLQKAFNSNPGKNYFFLNLRWAYSTSLQKYTKTYSFEKASNLAEDIYKHFRNNKSYYEKNSVTIYDIDNQVAGAFGSVCGMHPDEKADPNKCIEAISSLLKKEPGNYQLKQILGDANTNAGRDMEGYRIRLSAYDDYKKLIKYSDPGIILSSPLKGKVLPVKYNPPKPKSHSGLWLNAVDYLLFDESGKNITYESPVYAPADGEITYIYDGHEELSNLGLKMDNGLTIGMVHFKPGSFQVKTGQRVKTGTRLGILGIKNNSHLHMHIFNNYGATLPFLFKNFRDASGKVKLNAMPEAGEYYYYP